MDERWSGETAAAALEVMTEKASVKTPAERKAAAEASLSVDDRRAMMVAGK